MEGEARIVESGDLFRLFTQDKEEYPLSHLVLLGVHAWWRRWPMRLGLRGWKGEGRVRVRCGSLGSGWWRCDVVVRGRTRGR